MKLSWHYIVILLLIGVIILQHQCSTGHDCPEVTEHSDTTIVPGDFFLDLIAEKDTVKEDTTIYKWRTREVPADIDIDTPAIVEDYLATRYYSDTFQEDSNFMAVVEDSVRNNRIVHRRFKHQNKREKKIITNTTEIKNKPRNQLYLGLEGGGNSQQFDFGPAIDLKTKDDNLFGYNYKIQTETHWFKAQTTFQELNNLINN